MIRPAATWLALAAMLSAPEPGGTLSGPERVGATMRVERVVGGPGTSKPSFWQRLTGEPADELFLRPYGVAWDGDDLLVADPAAGRVLRIDPRGRARRSAPGLLEGPIGVASCQFGVVVTDSRAGTVTLLDRNLELVRRLAEGLDRPTGVACAEGAVFVVETARHRILALAPDGSIERELGRRGPAQGEFNFPAALAIGPGSLWVGDTLNFRVQNLALREGAFLGVFGRLGDAIGDTPRVKGLARDPQGRIWLTDGYLDRVLVFGGDGAFLADVGRPGSGPGEFSFPAGIAVHGDGRVAIADSLNRRVQVLRVEEPGGSP